MEIRASRIPLAIKCSQSRREPAILIQGDMSLAELGTDVHAILADYVDGKETPYVSGELGMLAYQGKRIWDEIKGAFPDPMTEQEIGGEVLGFFITGHPDVVSVIEGDGGIEVRVLDWKSGRIEDPLYFEQLKAYAFLVAHYFEAAKVSVTIAWLRTGEYETKAYTREELTRWASSASRRLDSKAFTPGDHCAVCALRHECEARHTLVKATIRELAEVDATSLRSLAPSRLAKIRDGVKLIEQAIGSFRDALKVELADGPMNLGDGRELYLDDVERTEALPEVAFPILQAKYGPDVLKAVRMSMTAIKDIAAEHAGSGEKGSARKAIVEELDQAGAIIKSKSQYIKERKSN